MSNNTVVASFYAGEGIRSRLDVALAQSGLSDGPIDAARLAFADQFHAGGLEATRTVGLALEAKEGSRILDAGSGFGGPARILAGLHGWRVDGVDLTPEYVEIATYLTSRTGQADHVSFQCADVRDIPFGEAEFDGAMTLHVGMNVEDKPRFYTDIFRVLKPGARLAIFDIVLSGEGAISYPMPWAANASNSFIVSAEKILEALQIAGFEIVTLEDKTPVAVQGFAEMRRFMQEGQAPPLTLVTLLGDRAIEAIQNLAGGLREGHLRAQLFVAQKANS